MKIKFRASKFKY